MTCEYHYKVSHLQFVCPDITAISFWSMNSIQSWYSETGGLWYDEPKANTWHALWYEFVTNTEVATLSQLPSINEAIRRRRLFGHVRRMDQAAPAYQTLHLSITSRRGSGQFDTRRTQPGSPRKCWVQQVTMSTGLSPDAWSVATDRSAWKVLRPVDGQA